MSYSCPDCGSKTVVSETRASSAIGTPFVVQLLARKWGGPEEEWLCRKRRCTNGECRSNFWTAEVEVSALSALTGAEDAPNRRSSSREVTASRSLEK